MVTLICLTECSCTYRRPTKSNIPKDIKALESSSDYRKRALAALNLQLVGVDAKEAIPALIVALEDDYVIVRIEAARAIGVIDSEGKAAKALGNSLIKDSDPRVREAAATALMNLGTKAKEVTPDLITALKDNDLWVKMYAAAALGEIGPERGVVEALISLLDVGYINDSNYYGVRAAAVNALAKFGIAAAPALPILEEINERDAVARITAAM